MRCGALISLRSRVLSRLANNINCVSNSSSTLSVVFLQATKLEIASDGDQNQNKRQPDAQAETLRQFHASPGVADAVYGANKFAAELAA